MNSDGTSIYILSSRVIYMIEQNLQETIKDPPTIINTNNLISDFGLGVARTQVLLEKGGMQSKSNPKLGNQTTEWNPNGK